MATLEGLVEYLSRENPDDAEDLAEALGVLQKQKLTVPRLAKLTEAQWARLGFPLGVETLIQEAVQTVTQHTQAPAAPVAERSTSASLDFGEEDSSRVSDPDASAGPAQAVLRQRRGGGGPSPTSSSTLRPRIRLAGRGSSEALVAKEKPDPQPDFQLQAPEDLDTLWQDLLADCLGPDKRASLQSAYEKCSTDSERYMMFLEYSSYLRKPQLSEEERKKRMAELDPILKQYGYGDDEDGGGTLVLWVLVIGVLVIVFAGVYYAFSGEDSHFPAHDETQL
mmetsp:Transcript_37768/g.90716  ORF Transcript_37768/g.90716 Transcript_37768/m.90716 type:complete len:280 (+) Transcript_37768:22-861(+)